MMHPVLLLTRVLNKSGKCEKITILGLQVSRNKK